jgi:Tol biopolymer transport system component
VKRAVPHALLAATVAASACGGSTAPARRGGGRPAGGTAADGREVRTVARIEGIAQCPHPLGDSGDWLVTRVTRAAVAQRLGADGSVSGTITGLGETETPEGRSALAYCAVPSPDGARVAYTVTSPAGWYGVEVRGLEGGTPVQLGAGVSPAWSPDGARVAYLTFGEAEPAAIVLADATSGRRAGSIPAPQGTVLASPPAWSPDGARIAFSAGPAQGASEFDVYVVASGGGPAKKLTRGGAWNLSPAWSSDGSRVVYHSKREEGSDLWSVAADGGDPARLFETAEEESDVVAWGPGLRWVATVPSTSDVYLYELGAGAARPERLAETPTEERAGAVTEGHDVIVVRWTDEDSDLWAQPLEGGDAWPLVTGPTRDGFPGVDPAGTLVAFLRTDGERTDVWVTPLERPTPRALTTDGAVRDGSPPRVSPDGTRVLYVKLGSGRQKDALVLQPIAGGPAVRLVDEPETYAWDPSGSSIVVSVYENDEPRLYRIRPDGRGRKERLRGDLEGLLLLGIATGGGDAIALDESDEPEILRVDLRTGDRRVELTLPGNVDPASVSVAFDPDLRHVVVAQNLVRSEIRELAEF